MDRDTRALAERWHAAGEPAIVIEVAEAQGSVPRERGTRMLVGASTAAGTIGGGHLEFKAMQAAREMLRTRELAPRSERIALGPSLGQCCGGVVSLHFAPLNADALARWPVTPPLLHLQMHGAGHVGRAIAALLAKLDVIVDWIDERDAEFPATLGPQEPWPAHVRRLAVDAVEDEVRHAPPAAHYLVLTHNHDLDLRITEAILRRGDFRYLGLIGSATKRERFVHRFEQRGIDAATIARMTCPIGVDGIAGKSPEIIAVAVVAQLLQHTDRPTEQDL
jgi:xanthine dehydrogenase accessory factor